MKTASYKRGFARSVSESQYPQLWKGCVGAWCPSLGPTGATLRDWSGRANHGVLTNMTLDTAWANNRGHCLSLDGVNDYVNIGTMSAIQPTNTTMTISSWVYRRSTALGGIVAYRNASGWVFAYDAGTGNLKLFTGSAWVVSSASVPLNSWTHASLVYNNSNISFYKNGVFDSTGNGTTATGIDPATIGAWDSGASGSPNALIDQVDIYNRALTDAEISLLWSIGRGGAYASRERRRVRSADVPGAPGTDVLDLSCWWNSTVAAAPGGLLLKRRRMCA